MIGPNCIGIIGVTPSLALTANTVMALPELPKGGLGVISQSGSLLGTFISRGESRGIGFSKLVSIGNECDLTVAEVANVMVDDPATEAILLFLETIRDAPALAATARRAFDKGKPILTYKLGRSEAANAVAASHTGSITGTDEAVDAFFRRHGIIRVDHFETLYEAPPLFIGQRPRPESAASVMTTTGGGGAMVVDNLSRLGIECLPLGEAAMARLDTKHGFRPQNGPLVDVTFGNANPEAIGALMDELIETRESAAMVFAVGSSARSNPDLTIRPLIERKDKGKPLAAFLVPEGEAAFRLLAKAGIAGFRTPEACADAVRAFLAWRVPMDPPDIPAPDDAVAAALSAGEGRILDEHRSRAVFEALGIPQADIRFVEDPTAAAEAASEIGYPVAVKVVSTDLPHKTDAGGVVLGVEDAVGIASATESIRRRLAVGNPGIEIEGFLVQRMETGLAEVLLGYRVDPLVGPTVVLGLGGILAEVYKEATLRLAPVDLKEAHRMIEEVPGLATIRGYRSMPRGNLEALAAAIVQMSKLALVEGSPVEEAEINPLMVARDGVVGVDGLIVLGA